MQNKWLKGFQALRGLLFILIFISHSTGYINGFGNLGPFGTSAFFVLSGFLSTYHYKPSDYPSNNIIIRFGIILKEQFIGLFHKIKKIYPLYFITMVAAYLIYRGNKYQFIKCILLIQSYFGNTSDALAYVGPLWFFSSILICFFLSPIINRFLSIFRKGKKGYIFLIFLSIVLFAIATVWSLNWLHDGSPYGNGYYYVYIFPPARLIEYFLGAILACFYCDNTFSTDQFSADIANILVLGLLIIAQIKSVLIPDIFSYTLLWIPFSMAFIWIFANENGFIVKQIIKSDFLLWIGNISLECFITHRLIMTYLNRITDSYSVVLWLYSFMISLLIAELYRRITIQLGIKRKQHKEH